MIDEIIKKYTPLGYSFLTEIDNSIACGKYELEDGDDIQIGTEHFRVEVK